MLVLGLLVSSSLASGETNPSLASVLMRTEGGICKELLESSDISGFRIGCSSGGMPLFAERKPFPIEANLSQTSRAWQGPGSRWELVRVIDPGRCGKRLARTSHQPLEGGRFSGFQAV